MNEMKFVIEVNGEIYCDDFGNDYTFNSYEEAQEFIADCELDNAQVVRQY